MFVGQWGLVCFQSTNLHSEAVQAISDKTRAANGRPTSTSTPRQVKQFIDSVMTLQLCLVAACLGAGWRSAAEVLAARKLGRCFYCWRWYCQVRLLREVAFQNKQRAIREALEVGQQVARRRKAALLASSFMAWHIQVGFAGVGGVCYWVP